MTGGGVTGGGVTGGGVTGGRGPARRAAAVLLLVIAVLAPAGCSTTVSDTLDRLRGDTPAPATTPPPSGVSWVSGAGTADPQAFGRWRNRPVGVWDTWNDSKTWSDMRGLYTLDQYEKPVRFAGKLSFAQPLLDQSSDYPSCVRGAYDADFADIAGKLAARGWGDAYIRLGWEMNGDWYAWKAGQDYAGFIGCFQRAATIFKHASPAFRIEWNPAATETSTQAAMTYPGDAFVDVVGADFYDGYPVAGTPAQFDAKCLAGTAAAPVGLCRYAEFARAHGKKLSVPEWGIRNDPSIGTTDNPLFIAEMAGFFTSVRDILAYESYFDLEGKKYEISSGLNPRAGAAYRTLFST